MNATEIDASIDDLLCRWHNFGGAYSIAKGYGRSGMFRDAVSPWSAYDRSSGVSDEYTERQIMDAVGRAVDAVPNHPQPWHTVILFEARNLATGYTVWNSARLPKDPQEMDVLRIEARNRLALQLQRQGVLGC